MRIEYIDGDTNGSFVQYFDNKVIEKIVWLGNYVKVGVSKFTNNIGEIIETDIHKNFGTCTVYFHHKPPKELSNVPFDTVYNRQYGMPVSEDGSKLFVGHWQKVRGKVKNGLQAYDIESDSLLWWLNEGKIRQIFLYSNYLIALQVDGAIFKVDIDNGEMLGQIKSGTLEDMFELDKPYVLVNAIRGKLCVVDTETMTVVKTYGDPFRSPIINPSNYFSLMIWDAVLQDNVLTISGAESNEVVGEPFSRVIDTSFSVF